MMFDVPKLCFTALAGFFSKLRLGQYRTREHAKRKRVERVGFEHAFILSSTVDIAEVVGSTPTRSTFYCVGNTALF
jgi:hypothetical protein